MSDRKRPNFRLRTLLFYVNLIILMLPVTGFWTLRIYENELVRRTEGELLAQGAFIREAYLSELARRYEQDEALAPLASDALSHPPAEEFVARLEAEREFAHIPSTIDLNRVELRPPASPPREVEHTPPEHLMRAGEVVSRLMRGTQKVTLAGMRVVDHRGVVVASSRGQFGLSLRHRDEVERALRGEYVKLVRRRVSDGPAPSFNSISRRSSVRLFVALPIVHEGRILGAVITSRTPLSLTRSLYDNRLALITLAVTQLLAVVLLTWYTSRTIVRPVHKLIAQARGLERGDGEATPLEEPVTHEVEELSGAIVSMARALQDRADYIKTFASNVSHEFKTPLTSIRGTVELLQDHLDEMSPEERERFVDMIDRDARRLQRLVNRLLDLARADVFKPGDHTCAPATILDDLAARYAVDGLDVTVEVDDLDGALARIAPVTLESIVANLIENARQHGGEDVAVTLRAARDGGEVCVEVIDDGPGVSEANRERIFTPFFTTARDTGGTGLGLSVVASLLQAHGGTIELLEAPPTTFRLCVPTAQPQS